MNTNEDITTTIRETNCRELVKLWESLDVPIFDNILVGHTGYLDRIKHEQLTAPVMKGKDGNGRMFIAFRVVEDINFVKGKKSKDTVLVAFERYSDKPFPWVTAIANDAPISHEAARYMPDCDKLKSLIAGETLVHHYKDSPGENTVSLKIV